jgi:methyl-accepting chemotaxis protein
LRLVAQSLNQFVIKRENIICKQKEIVLHIDNSTENLQGVRSISNEPLALLNTEQLAIAINEMIATVQYVSKNTVNASDSSVTVNYATHLGQQAVVNTLS